MKSAKDRILRGVLFCTLFCSVFSGNGLASRRIWYVNGENGIDPTDCTGGDTWGTAFLTIQKAIDCASPDDEIWVKGGTYALDSTIDVHKAVALYGGFAGVETQRDQRDWKTNVSIVDGQYLVRCFNVTADATLDGFTISRGYVSNPPYLSLGMVYTYKLDLRLLIEGLVDESVRKEFSVWEKNLYDRIIGSQTIEDQNSLLMSENRKLSVEEIQLENNIGGGMFIESSSPTIINCIFSDNWVFSGGGGIFVNKSFTKINNCAFSDNFADGGGGYL
jgi:hypothetical protein